MRDLAPDDAVTRLAADHAGALLRAFGLPDAVPCLGDHPALAWRRAGLMAVTGAAEGPGLVCPVAVTAAADGVLAALRALAPGAPLPAQGAVLLGERARLLGLVRRGDVSANGSCRLLPVKDGLIALNLPRPDDWAQLEALFGTTAVDWADVARLALVQERAALLEQGRLLGLAIAPDEALPPPVLPFTAVRAGVACMRKTAPLVVDLSALWAGPLAGSLLAACGARVVKVESTRRPDGARGGHAGFYDLLNAGKQSVALDFADAQDAAMLRRLVGAADIVIESARPRALAALGIDAGAEMRRGAVWLSITAHGREGAAADWIGFGDDAAVAGGLSAAMREGWGPNCFAGDAIADPLTGITAAFAAWAGLQAGGGWLISLALSAAVAQARGLYQVLPAALRHWQRLAAEDRAPLYPLRAPAQPAPPLGADNAAVLHRLLPP